MDQPDHGIIPAIAMPSLRTIARHSGTSILQATAAPTALFYLGWLTLGHIAAFSAALAWAVGLLARRLHRRERVPGLLIVSLVALTTRTVAALATGSTYVYFLQPVVTSVLVGSAFLGSAMTARPFVERIAGDFYPLTLEIAQRPRIRRLFRHLTVIWGVANITDAGVTFWLLSALPIGTFVAVRAMTASGITWLAIALTVACSGWVARSEGLVLRRAPAMAV